MGLSETPNLHTTNRTPNRSGRKLKLKLCMAFALLIAAQLKESGWLDQMGAALIDSNMISPPNQQTNQQPVGNQFIQCDEPVYDFGWVSAAPKKRVVARFPIKNISDDAIWIRSTMACACTSPRLHQRIAPNETVNVVVPMLISKTSGNVSKAVQVHVVGIGDPPGYVPPTFINRALNRLIETVEDVAIWFGF